MHIVLFSSPVFLSVSVVSAILANKRVHNGANCDLVGTVTN